MIPVHIISGFLGAGKTTMIIRLLGRKPETENWAIIINEFGKISIDAQTLQSKSAEGSLYEISGGCICCSAKGYFAENLDKIVRAKGYIYTGNEWVLFNYTLSGISTERCDQRTTNELVFIYEVNDIFDSQDFIQQIESLAKE